MARRFSRRRSRGSKNKRAHLLGATLGVIGLGILGAIGLVYATVERPPALDQTSLCPLDGARSLSVVLLDTSDDLPQVAKSEVTTLLLDLAETLPPYGLMDIRVLDPIAGGARSLFAKCNPGDGSGLSEWKANPELARKRWKDSFRKPVEEAFLQGLQSTQSQTSPIMGAIQRIAVERFSGRVAADMPKSLVLVSDMIEHGPDYSQYTGDLRYERFKLSTAYKKFQTDLKGAAVTIRYVQRLGPRHLNSADHIGFWHDWIRDNNGRFAEASKLQGAGKL